MTQQWQPDIVIYHDNCADGFGAAYACWKCWGNEAFYQPASYGKPPMNVAGKNVLIVDFSYKRAILDEMAQSAKSIVILDHHKSAQEDLAAFAIEQEKPLLYSDIPHILRDLYEWNRPPVIASLNMNRSGAALAWLFCNMGPVPKMIELIEDRDLWLFKHEESRPFGLYLRSLDMAFAQWQIIDHLMQKPETAQALMQEANAIERYFDTKARDLCNSARWIHLGGYTAIAVNCPPFFASEVGHTLLDLHPSTPFAVCYSDHGTGRAFSLRSEDARLDVSAIASKFGGGGHRNAAGFSVPLP